MVNMKIEIGFFEDVQQKYSMLLKSQTIVEDYHGKKLKVTNMKVTNLTKPAVKTIDRKRKGLTL